MNKFRFHLYTTSLFRVLILIALFVSNSIAFAQTQSSAQPFDEPLAAPATQISILVDDFKPQPYQGDSLYHYNRLNGDRGAVNDSIVELGIGQMKITVSDEKSSGGLWESLNHPIREALPVNFSTILPVEILPAYQSRIVGIAVQIADGTAGRSFKLELKDGNDLRWNSQSVLSGGQQLVSKTLPLLANINQLVLKLDNAAAGDFVIVERISFTASVPVKLVNDTATSAFVWSYGMLLNNWDPETGLVRDKAKDASTEFDAIQATGGLAAATALAAQLGIISRTDAVAIVKKIGDTLLNKVPRFMDELHGLWPHWVNVSTAGDIALVGPDGRNDITGQPCQPDVCTDHNGDGLNDVTKAPCDPAICTDKGTEWSSVDTVIAAIGLLDAQNALGLSASGTQQMLASIDWESLKTPNGISHGYDFTREFIPYSWDNFGGESWLAELAHASATGQLAPLPAANASPPTANGSGFIDELAWLFVRPPSGTDFWDTDWEVYRATAASIQISYYATHFPSSCFSQLGLFGLSAAEVPDPSLVSKTDIYQAFGVGGRFSSANDGTPLLGVPVVVPHYSAMIASLHPQEAIAMWDWLIGNGYFSPLNNTESLMVKPLNTNCASGVVYNDLKGSWNLTLQSIGWGIYLARQKGRTPSVWLATSQNLFLRHGYFRLAPPPKGLKCVAFSPYVNDYNPNIPDDPRMAPPAAVIDQLLDMIIQYTDYNCIMTYGTTSSLYYIFPAAQVRGLKVFANIWLEPGAINFPGNGASIQAGIMAAKEYPDTIVRLSCGVEVRNRAINHGLPLSSAETVINDCLDQLRAAGVTQPITTIDTWWNWCNAQWPCQVWSMANNVDWIGINVYPWWENKYSGLFPCTTAAEAPQFHLDRIRDVQATYPTKEVILTEFGWPAGPDGYSETNQTTGQKCGIASKANQDLVIDGTRTALDNAGLQWVVFEALREPWKIGEGPIGPFWGTMIYPAKAVLQLPRPHASTNITPSLGWTPVPDAYDYEIEIAHDKGFAQVVYIHRVPAPPFTPAISLADGPYYWHVRTYNVFNQHGAWSDARDFTIDTQVLSAPVLKSPSNGASVRGVPTFRWSVVASAVQYQFEMDTESAFSGPVYSVIRRVPYFRPAGPLQGTYYWRVRARDAAGNWSAWSQFTVNILPLR